MLMHQSVSSELSKAAKHKLKGVIGEIEKGEGKLAFAVIGQALDDYFLGYNRELHATLLSTIAELPKLSGKIRKGYAKLFRAAEAREDAERFFDSEIFEHWASVLGLESEYVRRVITTMDNYNGERQAA